MRARLTALQVEGKLYEGGGPAAQDARVRLAAQMGDLGLYAALSPLEKLFARPEPLIRIAVLKAMQTLTFKRSFITVRAGLSDPELAVVEQATKAVEALHFPHAFDPLARIVRESAQPSARAAALRALARIDTVEAAELLLGVLAHGPSSDRLAALTALQRTAGAPV